MLHTKDWANQQSFTQILTLHLFTRTAERPTGYPACYSLLVRYKKRKRKKKKETYRGAPTSLWEQRWGARVPERRHPVSPLILGLPTANVRDGTKRRELRAAGEPLSLEPCAAESKTSAPCTERHPASQGLCPCLIFTRKWRNTVWIECFQLSEVLSCLWSWFHLHERTILEDFLLNSDILGPAEVDQIFTSILTLIWWSIGNFKTKH